MKYFIGITPPEDCLEKIRIFQMRWKSNRLPYMVDPHVTIKSQAELTDDLAWLERIEKICRKTAPFPMALGRPEWFGDHVLFLSVLSEKISELHQTLVEAVNPPQDARVKFFEGNTYYPHLTLGIAGQGMSVEDLKEMEQQTSALQPYPHFQVHELNIYQCDEKMNEEKYRRYIRLPLSKAS